MSDSEIKDAAVPSQNGDDKAGAVTEKPLKDLVTQVEPRKEINAPDTINESDDKLDEFSRLELEMAELNKTDDGVTEEKSPSSFGTGIEDKQKDPSDVSKDIQTDCNFSEQQDNIDEDTPIIRQNGQSTETAKDVSPVVTSINTEVLDHEDLIAVLKGETVENPLLTDKNKLADEEPPKEILNATTDTDLLIEGVTIEGEGKYQIMEVIDEIDEETESVEPPTSKIVNVSSQTTNKAAPSQKLTPEEERAMAMEQIAGLNARVPRRRKQDIKTLQVETSDLVSTLGDDWSDDEEDIVADFERPTSSKNLVLGKPLKQTKKEASLKSQATEVSSTAVDTKPAVAVSVTKKRRTSVSAKVTSVVLVKPDVGEVANDVSNNVVDSTKTQTSDITGSTGFKRTRTIKRRIIWDPDAPETTISYAKLVRSNAKDRPDISTSVAPLKPRCTTPKESITIEKRGTKRAATSFKSGVSKLTAGESAQKADSMELPLTSKRARRSQTISPDVSSSLGTLVGGKKKKISEIDRLMSDEGAANMLNSLESGRSKNTEDSDDKPHKPLMRNRGTPIEKAPKKEGASTNTSLPASPPKNKRVVKQKASNSWDYVYQKKQQLSDDSMIIRRRSNSSYSSNASQHRLSLDGPSGSTTKSNAKNADVSPDDAAKNENSPIPRKSTSKAAIENADNASAEESVSIDLNKSAIGIDGNSFEFAKPKEAKSNQKTTNRRNKANSNTSANNTLANDIKKPIPKRLPRRPALNERLGNAEQTTAQSSLTSSLPISPGSIGEEVCVRKLGKTSHILLDMSGAQIPCTYTPQLMNKVVNALNSLAEDVNCHVVVVTTNSPHFCQGIDIGNLATGSVEQRKSAAIVLATATKNFLRTLATFPKPLIAGIHGTIIGLGVIQLPLFDIVVASDKTCFEAPYAKIGQIPEGFCIWQCSSNVRKTAITKLLWLAEKMYSNEAATTGLIDKLTTAGKVTDDAMNIAKKMASMSTETYRCMKQANIQKRLSVIMSSLDDEFDKIIEQWISAECFNKFKKYMEVGHF